MKPFAIFFLPFWPSRALQYRGRSFFSKCRCVLVVFGKCSLKYETKYAYHCQIRVKFWGDKIELLSQFLTVIPVNNHLLKLRKSFDFAWKITNVVEDEYVELTTSWYFELKFRVFIKNWTWPPQWLHSNLQYLYLNLKHKSI